MVHNCPHWQSETGKCVAPGFDIGNDCNWSGSDYHDCAVHKAAAVRAAGGSREDEMRAAGVIEDGEDVHGWGGAVHGRRGRKFSDQEIQSVTGRPPSAPPLQIGEVLPPHKGVLDYIGARASSPSGKRKNGTPVETGGVTHSLGNFSTALVVILHFATAGIFTFIWFNLMHSKMPKTRHDDPSAGKAIGFLFIPLYNLYWIFFTYLRLVDRLNQQRVARGLPGPLRGLTMAVCILSVIPYVNLVTWLIIWPIWAGLMQRSVNELATVTAQASPAPPAADAVVVLADPLQPIRDLLADPPSTANYGRLKQPSGEVVTCFLIREEASRIAALPEQVAVDVRTGLFERAGIGLFAALLSVEGELYETWWNWCNPLHRLCFHDMTRQDELVLCFFVNTVDPARTIRVPNQVRDCFRLATERLQKSPPWDMQAFDGAREALYREYASVQALWIALANRAQVADVDQEESPWCPGHGTEDTGSRWLPQG